jgi:FKBP-type peptidyl-prolyl cis-trans isomerase FkpA
MKSSILRSLSCTALGAAFLIGCKPSAQVPSQSAASPTLAPLTTKTMTESPLEKGEKFLAENKTKEGVKTTASGLQYKITEEGTGKSPASADHVLVHYEGKLLDGTIFDSSIKRGEPIAFPLNGVIPGWTEGLQLMKEGGKAILYIPSKLAYGARGTPGGPIGPNETLIFEVQLIKIQ